MKNVLAILCVIFTGYAFMACHSPVEPPESEPVGTAGSLTITVNDGISRAIVPVMDMNPAYYLVEGTGPGSASFSESTTDSITRDDLPAGEWIIVVTAYNASDIAIGSGSTTVTVNKHSTVNVNISVTPYSGFGTLDLTLEWVAGALVNPDIEATLELSDGTSRDLSFIVADYQATFFTDDIPAGFHTLIVKLTEGSGYYAEDIAGAVELIRIVEGITTTGSITFTALNIAAGDIEVGITPELADPLDVSILGVEESKYENIDLTLSAEVSNYDESLVYVWYINANAVEVGESFTLDDSWSQDLYRIDLIASTADGRRGGSASAYIDVLPEWNNPDEFISVWDLSLNDVTTLTIPLVDDGNYDFTIDWGDGTVESYTESGVSHDYASAAEYRVTITGLCEGFGYSLSSIEGNEGNLVDIEQWGSVKLNNQPYKFCRCDNLTGFSAKDSPDLTGINNLSYMFFGSDTFNGDVSAWNVSSITDMSGMFSEAPLFNQDISGWDTSSVFNMSEMFSSDYDEDPSFNQNLSDWDVSSVTDMSSMFSYASAFNGDLSNWNVSSVTDMSNMFYGADQFNQDISGWNVSSVTDMSYLFSSADSFNQNISNWDVSSVTKMRDLFSWAVSFNQDIGGWDVSSVSSMSYMFDNAHAFNQDISNWDISSVWTMTGMFTRATSFNQDISGWDTYGVQYMGDMFSDADSFTQDLSEWDVSTVKDMSGMFYDADAFNQDLSEWDVSKVTDMSYMFSEADAFNQDLSEWDVSTVRDMSSMFSDADAFNQDLSGWDVSSVQDIYKMFYLAHSFTNGENAVGLESWNTENLSDMDDMFTWCPLDPLPSWYTP